MCKSGFINDQEVWGGLVDCMLLIQKKFKDFQKNPLKVGLNIVFFLQIFSLSILYFYCQFSFRACIFFFLHNSINVDSSQRIIARVGYIFFILRTFETFLIKFKHDFIAAKHSLRRKKRENCYKIELNPKIKANTKRSL